MKRFSFISIIAGLLVIITLGLSSCGMLLMGALLGDDSSENNNNSNNNTTPTRIETTAAKTEAPTKKTAYYAGETATVWGLEISFSDFSGWESDNMFIEPEEGYAFVRVYFTIKNTTDSDKSIGAWDFDCYADGVKCEQSIYGDDALSFYDTISAGRSIKGYIYYEVPYHTTKIEIEYEPNSFFEDKVLFIVYE